jgi:hypothetical protein
MPPKRSKKAEAAAFSTITSSISADAMTIENVLEMGFELVEVEEVGAPLAVCRDGWSLEAELAAAVGAGVDNDGSDAGDGDYYDEGENGNEAVGDEEEEEEDVAEIDSDQDEAVGRREECNRGQRGSKRPAKGSGKSIVSRAPEALFAPGAAAVAAMAARTMRKDRYKRPSRPKTGRTAGKVLPQNIAQLLGEAHRLFLDGECVIMRRLTVPAFKHDFNLKLVCPLTPPLPPI